MWHFAKVLGGLLEPSVGSNSHQSGSRVLQKTVCFIGTFGMWDFACLTPYPSWSWLRFDAMGKYLDQGLHVLNLLFFGIIDFILVLYAFLASREGKKSPIGGHRNRQQSTMTWRWKTEKCEIKQCLSFPRNSENSSSSLEVELHQPNGTTLKMCLWLQSCAFFLDHCIAHFETC